MEINVRRYLRYLQQGVRKELQQPDSSSDSTDYDINKPIEAAEIASSIAAVLVLGSTAFFQLTRT